MSKKILIFGRTGAGKTTLAKALAPLIGGVVLDGDDVRQAMSLPRPGDHAEREQQALRMSLLADLVTASGNNAICSFVCPTGRTRMWFGSDFTIWVDRNGDGKYPDTQAMFEDPLAGDEFDLRTTNGHPPEYWASVAADMLQPVFNPLRKTALFVGRYQPFHEGHKALVVEGIKRHGQACIGVRDENRDWPFQRVKQLIDFSMRDHVGRYSVLSLPNIGAVCYGRDVGYNIECITLPPEIEKISGTTIRELANGRLVSD